MPATRWYKVRLCRIKTHGSASPSESGLCTKVMKNSIADSSTSASPILDLIAGDCRPQHRLHNDIRSFPPAIFIHEVTVLNSVLAITELDGRFLHNHLSDPESDCGRIFGSTPATPRCKIHLCRINTQEIANPCESGLHFKYPGVPRTRWLIPPQPLIRS